MKTSKGYENQPKQRRLPHDQNGHYEKQGKKSGYQRQGQRKQLQILPKKHVTNNRMKTFQLYVLAERPLPRKQRKSNGEYKSRFNERRDDKNDVIEIHADSESQPQDLKEPQAGLNQFKDMKQLQTSCQNFSNQDILDIEGLNASSKQYYLQQEVIIQDNLNQDLNVESLKRNINNRQDFHKNLDPPINLLWFNNQKQSNQQGRDDIVEVYYDEENDEDEYQEPEENEPQQFNEVDENENPEELIDIIEICTPEEDTLLEVFFCDERHNQVQAEPYIEEIRQIEIIEVFNDEYEEYFAEALGLEIQPQEVQEYVNQENNRILEPYCIELQFQFKQDNR
ncbi:UNKNOWN [Stylonychia lemnae]|uniref:Uncharacterized protein n=1 Tax=Stylonychia lemnae TaxID=5949 RepID=A0A078A488_STYLE|nr:UNKNOWN [Stylonychia lemnae]|eukprot:CDW76972.1 UNKNOWN [Stylonychia lemnae]